MRLFIFLLPFLFINVLVSQVTPAERVALQAFYNATDGPNWISENDADLTNDWNFAGPVTDDWYGLTVVGGNVVGIDMNPTNTNISSNNLTGELPNEIGDLAFLQVLDVGIQNLSGQIPDRLTELTELRYLRLKANQFTGPIPDTIDNLTELVFLDFENNEFNGEIPVTISQLTNLQTLRLRGNLLTGEIPIEITDMISLRILRLGVNQFTGYVYPEYGNLINLTELGLGNNQLTGEIPIELQSLVELRILILSFNELTGGLPVELRTLVNAEYINFSNNNLTGIIPTEYGEWISMINLVMAGNQLTGQIPESFENLTNLQYLDLGGNELSGTLSPSFSAWTDIITLNLGQNQFSGNIPDSYASFSNLERLTLSDNLFSGELSPLFSQWSSITSVYLNDNDFNGEIPDTYSAWVTLESLVIVNNQFGGELSPSFSNWSSASYLHFGENFFEGNLPNFTGVLSTNDILNINDNRFQFGDFEDEFDHYDQNILGFSDADQAKVNDIEFFDNCVGSSITLSTIVSGAANVYQWLKDGSPISGASDADLILDPLSVTDAGVYTCEITSTIVTDLTLERNPITVSVNDNAPTANEIDNITACDLDGDGFAVFPINLANLESQTVESQTGLTVSYFDATGNLLVLTDNYTNTIPNTQTVTVRVTNSSGCEDETSFNLITTTPATAEQFDDTTACGSFTLPELDLGNNYYTQPDAEGTQLQPGENITTTQTIYIYAGIGDCSDQTNFTVTIEPLLTVDELDDITECGVFTLPQLNNGSYYTQSGGTGILMNSGEAITQTQTIFIYDENDTCFAESTFQVTIDFIACENSDEAIKLKFPNFFTPNEDGSNDVWKVDQDFFTLEGTVTIYDRYGKLLYQFDAKNGGWNGTFNGRRLTATDYWYRFVEAEGNAIITGHFSLKR
ncbi:T9SS type B sorting domain-containing protein [Maribacter sp. BPC-D8]|uniref:T9SS type B sorting domain-containing protein n=1 Tax=Maribacter sp. BPC-D8 TaxID=3053613 RepID=UPI002B494294|nr:T9SS type B sorting domain-containing protein [Maribacter sp. BPC-D8]WRI28372.1 T9SS type B sorting domain-containing protein [Maribacter sp. BPC-D8]